MIKTCLGASVDTTHIENIVCNGMPVTIIYTVMVQFIRAEKLIGVYDFAALTLRCTGDNYWSFSNVFTVQQHCNK